MKNTPILIALTLLLPHITHSLTIENMCGITLYAEISVPKEVKEWKNITLQPPPNNNKKEFITDDKKINQAEWNVLVSSDPNLKNRMAKTFYSNTAPNTNFSVICGTWGGHPCYCGLVQKAL